MDEFVRYLCTKCTNEKVEIARSIGAEGACRNSQVKGNEFGRRSGEQLELYRRSNLSGKRTEADKKHF